jgi:hypothetical protein
VKVCLAPEELYAVKRSAQFPNHAEAWHGCKGVADKPGSVPMHPVETGGSLVVNHQIRVRHQQMAARIEAFRKSRGEAARRLSGKASLHSRTDRLKSRNIY